MRALKIATVIMLALGTNALIACAEKPENDIFQKAEQHFSSQTAEPVRVSTKTNALTILSVEDANKIHDQEQKFRVTCGDVTVIDDDLTYAMGVCKTIMPNSDMVISAA